MERKNDEEQSTKSYIDNYHTSAMLGAYLHFQL